MVGFDKRSFSSSNFFSTIGTHRVLFLPPRADQSTPGTLCPGQKPCVIIIHARSPFASPGYYLVTWDTTWTEVDGCVPLLESAGPITLPVTDGDCKSRTNRDRSSVHGAEYVIYWFPWLRNAAERAIAQLNVRRRWVGRERAGKQRLDGLGFPSWLPCCIIPTATFWLCR